MGTDYFMLCENNSLTMSETAILQKAIRNISLATNTVTQNKFESMDGIEFEKFCQILIERMGLAVERTSPTRDGGIDLVANCSNILFTGKYYIQCKRYSGSVGVGAVRDLYGVVTAEKAVKGILITTGTFTNSAIEFANDLQLELIDKKGIQEIMNMDNSSNEEKAEDISWLNPLFDENFKLFEASYGEAKYSVRAYIKCVEALFFAMRTSDVGDLYFGEEDDVYEKTLAFMTPLLQLENSKSARAKYIFCLANLMMAEIEMRREQFGQMTIHYLKAFDTVKSFENYSDWYSREDFTTYIIHSIIESFTMLGLKECADNFLVIYSKDMDWSYIERSNHYAYLREDRRHTIGLSDVLLEAMGNQEVQMIHFLSSLGRENMPDDSLLLENNVADSGMIFISCDEDCELSILNTQNIISCMDGQISMRHYENGFWGNAGLSFDEWLHYQRLQVLNYLAQN